MCVYFTAKLAGMKISLFQTGVNAMFRSLDATLLTNAQPVLETGKADAGRMD